MTSPLPPGPERLRRFRDPRGVDWTVWEVDAPHIAESAHRLVYLDPALASGWLAFESTAGERRRLVPIPVGWQGSSDEQLRGLLARAASVGAGRTAVEPTEEETPSDSSAAGDADEDEKS